MNTPADSAVLLRILILLIVVLLAVLVVLLVVVLLVLLIVLVIVLVGHKKLPPFKRMQFQYVHEKTDYT